MNEQYDAVTEKFLTGANDCNMLLFLYHDCLHYRHKYIHTTKYTDQVGVSYFGTPAVQNRPRGSSFGTVRCSTNPRNARLFNIQKT